jgi:CRISPR-associated protein (TIGR02584 family)
MKKTSDERQKKHILLAVVGMTPQVVTETLFGLAKHRGVAMSELCIITTADGKNALLGAQGFPPLQEEVHRMCSRWKIREPYFDLSKTLFVASEETVELHDVRTDRENRLFPNLISNVVRQYTADPSTVLHCSIAGGRKTMSVAMAFALSLFGRTDDKLYHVVVSKEFEASRKFYPETDEEASQIVLAEMPYVRLRDKLPLLRDYPQASFSDLVSLAQGVVDEMIYFPPLVFMKAERTVMIGDRRIPFRPFDFAFYLFCATQKKPIPAGKRFSDQHWKKLQRLYERLSPSYGHRMRMHESFSSAEKRIDLVMKSASTIRRVLTQALGKKMAQQYQVSSIGQYGDVRYEVLLDRAKIVVK